MKKTYIITGIAVSLSTIALFIFIGLGKGGASGEINYSAAMKGGFEIAVTGIGELVPERSVNIAGPKLVQYRNIRMAGLKITDIIPEGSRIKKGDYIATLDKSNFDNNLKDELTKLKVLKDSVEMKILDTAVVLSTLRDDIRNQSFTVEEAEITVAQSKFEPPATIRLAELSHDRAQRLLEQKKNLYSLQRQQAKADIKNLKVLRDIQQRTVNDLQQILAQFTITAPADGILIYKTDRAGIKIKAGSTLNPFDPVVATLPDLSSMLSKVYVSEIEVNKVKKGQPVQITLDALQKTSLTGKVASIANIGEELPNSDSKMFEVLIKVDNSDPRLLPSMTTSNKLIIRTYENVTFVPIECVHAGEDSIPFVYTRSGDRQIVIPGEADDKNIIIEKGLTAGTEIWVRTPDDPSRFSLAGIDLIPVIREREKIRRIELASGKENELLSQTDKKSGKPENISGGSSAGSSSGD
jgi:HlyD family secretion protein